MRQAWICLSFLALALAAMSCAGSVRPVRDTDRMTGGLVVETGYLVRQPVAVQAPFGITYTLPEGEYVPTHVDDHGIFYASPTGVLETNGETERNRAGGIHSPREPGQYYSYPSLYVDRGDGDFSKLPLPDEVLQLYGDVIVFTHLGYPVH